MPASFWKKVIDRILYINLFLVVVIALVFYFLLSRNAKKLVTNQITRQGESIAASEASNITTFFNGHGDSLLTLANSISISPDEKTTIGLMDDFISKHNHADIINGIVLTDASGKVIYNSNITKKADLGQDISERNYFIWSKYPENKGKYLVSDSAIGTLGASKGKAIIPVATPVYRDGVFVGMLASAIGIDKLSDHYIDILVPTTKVNVHLIENDNIISSTDHSLMGQYFNTDKFQKDNLIVSKKFQLQDKTLEVVILYPLKEVDEVVKPLYVRQFSVFSSVVLAVLLITMAIKMGDRKSEV